MSKQVQFRRGTTAEHSTFTGAVGEITVDTTKDTVVVHDGSTVGGFPLLRESAYTATDVLTKLKTVDGSGSGLDADLLDGQSSSYYATVSGQIITDTIMSKAAFNALASERRANRSGSGFDEFGKHNASLYPNVNDGIWTNPTRVNGFTLGRESTGIDLNGTSKTTYALSIINGCINKLSYLNSNVDRADITLPPAPTVLPYDATLTPEQIASGVIKHADASNSGLIVNGKFDTNTSGWTGYNGASLAVISNTLRVTTTTASWATASQPITCVVGKKYSIEVNVSNIASTCYLYAFTGVSSGSINSVTLINGRNTLEFTATLATHYIGLQVASVTVGTYADFDNIAVFPADAISRSELVFLESWHEDVSEKDFVYPLGNVQYLGTTGDSDTPVTGAFAGSGTYSLFGNWQASGALVGKGYVWSTLSDAKKKAFVANPENNVYLDGDKYIQVRYRIRVVAGMGDSWNNIDPNSTANTSMTYNSSSRVKPKGKRTSIASELNTYNVDNYGWYISKVSSELIYTTEKVGINGIFQCVCSTGTAYVDKADFFGYEGKCYALPIAIVHRRNQGGYNATYNPHGTRTMTMSPTSIADCFNNANLNTSTGYIGTSTSRADGLFYDQISVEDFKPSNKGADLRNSSKKRTAQNIIEEFAPKVIAGTLLYNNNDTTALTTYKDFMEVRDTSGNRYAMKSKVGNVVNIVDTVANKKGFSVVTQNGKQFLQVADDATSDTTVQMNLSVTKYDLGVFDA